MNKLKINGISVIDYGGNGLPIVFVHAFPLCSRMWDKQAEYFKKKYRVIVFDIRGLGYSYDPADLPFTMEDLTDDFFSILDGLKLDKVIACGLSLGGYILLRALVRDQGRFLSAILADTKSESENNDSLIGRYAMIKNLKSGKDGVFDEFIKKLISKTSYENEGLKSFIKEMMSWMDIRGICSAILAIASRTNTSFQLKNISIPVLAIAGKEDIITPPLNSVYICENLMNAEFKFISGAGHLSNMEAPDEFNKAIETFLNKNNLL
ncbi:MAG: 3-oxoadipate enol-lactonase 2 [Ignavibacteria bacterium]|nr:3-oxoadipate enol-lactonase 2 [Ignavibacteria bacterium]